MIKENNVVLVLGAGASAPYGYPLGEGLVERIKALNENEINQFVQNYPDFSADHVIQFQSDLRKSGRRSIDRFLQSQSDYSEVGKMMIVLQLLQYEKPEFLHTPKEDRWYPYLYDDIINPKSPEEFNNNTLSIITYNYDRSLEKFFFDVLKSCFSLTDIQAAQCAQAIPIVHVHGSFGDLPNMGNDVREYAANYSDINAARKRLHIVSDDIEESGVLDVCGKLLLDASHVVFLGFGYDSVNLTRLRLSSYCAGAKFHGAAFGMERSEISQVDKAHFENQGLSFEWDGDKVDCLQYLRRHRELFV